MNTYKIVAINLGSTSTKIAYYENDHCVLKDNINHNISELKQFATLFDQYQYRYDAIIEYIKNHGINAEELDCVVTRGGHTTPLEGGTYRINRTMLEQSKSGNYGSHATDIGLQLAYAMGQNLGCVALTVDPPTTDEFEPLARYSGLPELPRRSSFHVLNHRAVARQYAKDNGKKYEEINLVSIHMGGGITVAVHRNGKLVDANNGLTGDGPFSTNRAGTLPAGQLVGMCFSGKYDYADIMKKINGSGGLVAHVGDSDVITVEKRAETDAKCSEVLDAMCYQVAKEVGAVATVVEGDVDAIIMTGGIANSQRITSTIKKRVEFIAPVFLYPGEFEMQSLALNAYDVVRGALIAKEL